MVGYGVDAPEDPPEQGETIKFTRMFAGSEDRMTAEVQDHEPRADGYRLTAVFAPGTLFHTRYEIDTDSGMIRVGEENRGVLTKLEIDPRTGSDPEAVARELARDDNRWKCNACNGKTTEVDGDSVLCGKCGTTAWTPEDGDSDD